MCLREGVLYTFLSPKPRLSFPVFQTASPPPLHEATWERDQLSSPSAEACKRALRVMAPDPPVWEAPQAGDAVLGEGEANICKRVWLPQGRVRTNRSVASLFQAPYLMAWRLETGGWKGAGCRASCGGRAGTGGPQSHQQSRNDLGGLPLLLLISVIDSSA